MISARVCGLLPGVRIIASLLLFKMRVLSRNDQERRQSTRFLMYCRQNRSERKGQFEEMELASLLREGIGLNPEGMTNRADIAHSAQSAVLVRIRLSEWLQERDT